MHRHSFFMVRFLMNHRSSRQRLEFIVTVSGRGGVDRWRKRVFGVEFAWPFSLESSLSSHYEPPLESDGVSKPFLFRIDCSFRSPFRRGWNRWQGVLGRVPDPLEPSSAGMMRLKRQKWIILGTLLVGACVDAPVMKPVGHILPPAPVQGSIPDPVTHSPPSTAPDPSLLQESFKDVYTISVVAMSVKDLLHALARDAKLNVDVHPDVQGLVTLNIVDQTLPQILERISQQVSLQYEEKAGTLLVRPDRPYVHTYQVNYLNLQRKAGSGLHLSSQIIANDRADSEELEPAVNQETSTVTVENTSENQFWGTLVTNIRTLLSTAGSSPVGAILDDAGEVNDVDEIIVRPEALDKRKETTILDDQSGSQDGETMVFADPQSGLLTVRATARQHEEVQRFLDRVMAGSRRQVRIEATVLEVRLNDRFQSGVDWSAVRDLSHNRSVSLITIPVNTQAGVNQIIAKEDPVFTLDMANPVSELANITGNIHNVSTAVRLLNQFGDVKVLSTPKLVALNNQMAVLKVVDNEVYFTVEKNESTNTNTTATTYTSKIHTVPIGLVMSVQPQISPDDEVTLIVRPTITRIIDFVTDPNPDLARAKITSRVPKIQVREMESILSVRSGQVAVIGGLMTNVVNKDRNTVPGLVNLPLFGDLFHSRDDTISKTELVLFLRPTVIRNDLDLASSRDTDRLRDIGAVDDRDGMGWGVGPGS